MKTRTVLTTLLALCLLAACGSKVNQPGSKDPGEEEMFYTKDDTLYLNLDSNPSTGFSWQQVFRSSNVELAGSAYEGNDHGAMAGAPGTERLEYRVTGDGEAWILIKYARPWEGEGDYLFFRVLSENGRITNVSHEEISFFTDLEQAWHSDGDDWLSVFVPKGWQSEDYSEAGRFGMKLTDGKGRTLLVYTSESEDPVESVEKEEILMIGEKEYALGTSSDGQILVSCIGGDRLFCIPEEGAWTAEDLPVLIRILDSADTTGE